MGNVTVTSVVSLSSNLFTYRWLKQLGQATTTTSSAQHTTFDSSGNIYITGYTTGSLAACGGVSANCSGSAYGTQDYFVSKYDSLGNQIWITQLGETGKTSSPSGIAVDSSGNIYVGGTTNAALYNCGATGGACGGLSSQGNNDYFISKYNNSGVWQWTSQLGETAKNTQAFGFGIDGSGNGYIAGYTLGNLASCNGVSTSCSGSSTGNRDLFVSKYTTGGSWVWTKQLGQSTFGVTVAGLNVDSSGNTYISGKSTGYLPGCGGTSGVCGGTAAQGTADAIIVKYNTAGAWQWTKQLGESSYTSSIQAVGLDGLGNLYGVGLTGGNLISCNGVSTSCTGASYGSQDFFVIKYSTAGTWLWTQQMGVPGYSSDAKAVVADTSGNVYVGGSSLGNTLNCNGNTHTCSSAVASTGAQDYFLARYASGGAWVSSHQVGQTGTTTSLNFLAMNSSGGLVFTGNTTGNLTNCYDVSMSCSGSPSGSTDLIFAGY